MALLVAASGALDSCSEDEAEPRPREHTARIDEVRGSYAGIAIGDPQAKVRGRFGSPDPADRDEECDLCPVGTTSDDDLGQPTFIAAPSDSRGSFHALRYPGVVFLTSRGRVYGFLVTDPRAATRRDVGIGHGASRVRDRYPGLDCGTANEGSEYPQFPYCAGRLGRLYVSFGEDPVRSVTVSSTPLQG